ncbi:unnamed protein product [Blumeria hordei]|uniref:Copper-fist domain-containing protein n=1 Tax=Blumeria hordei TaxID=2867405 RepID=A0A383UYE0_BLUHO|nr:unnamed protein product [Blumeria hordei]
MPLINGMKMACEPCIRGHRSTKCTHANERLMVPVRKPGRPLSACPHPRDQMCNCSSVIAAIPRKQTCVCGNDKSTQDSNQTPVIASTPSETPQSPSKQVFRVDKNHHRPLNSTRKQPCVANLERMDNNLIKVYQPFSTASAPVLNGYHTPSVTKNCFIPQYVESSLQYPQISTDIPVLSATSNDTSREVEGCKYKDLTLSDDQCQVNRHTPQVTSGYYTNEHINLFNSSSIPESIISKLNGTIRSPLDIGRACDSHKYSHINRISDTVNVSYNFQPEISDSNKNLENPARGPCCESQSKNPSHSSSTVSIPEILDVDTINCCLSKNSQPPIQGESSSTSTQILPQSEMDFDSNFYPYSSQPTIFTYPASYGSFSNPLDATIWRQNHETQFSQHQGHVTGQLSYDSTIVPGILSTSHKCTCGDNCQCVGCAAHPYNDATQDYVRSAWHSMSLDYTINECNPIESSPNDIEVSPEKIEGVLPQQTIEINSQNSPSPSSLSASCEEQSLSANDFFFVNYSLPPDGFNNESLNISSGTRALHAECDAPKRNPG